MSRSVLITGAGGYIGSLLTRSLAAEPGALETIVATDIRRPEEQLPDIRYEALDIRDPGLAEILSRYQVDTVVHLAAVVSAGKHPDRELEYDIDVGGTLNVLESCIRAGVGKVIISSSGAAYGYHPDHPEWIAEDAPIRGNAEFTYSDHKRQIEEMLAEWCSAHPELGQLILRPGTILGRSTNNQITDLFDRPVILGMRGSATPFVFIWDEDMVGILRRGIETNETGVYNVAGDGVMTMREIADRLGKRYVNLPVALVRSALWLLRKVRLTQYGPEQVNFLRYRPVLSNAKLKSQFGYVPRKTSAEAFEVFVEGRNG